MKLSVNIALVLLALLSCGSRAPKGHAAETVAVASSPQSAEGSVSWDRTVFDFGDVSVADGPLSCSFTLTNTGTEPIAIFEVVSSCGCTDVSWTRSPILPGKTGTVTATYKNEDGAMPFDKSLTVYISGLKRPVVLRLRGVVHEKKKSLSQRFGAGKLGDFGIKERVLRMPPMDCGTLHTESVGVANLGQRPISVSFADVPDGLSLRLEPNPLPPGKEGSLSYTLSAAEGLYGSQSFPFTLLVNGKGYEGLSVESFYRPSFPPMSEKERREAPLPMFNNSTVSLGKVSSGQVLEAVFPCRNQGRQAYRLFKADCESPALRPSPMADVPGSGKGEFRVTLDTQGLPKGENVLRISLIGNAPLRPVINLFVVVEIA
ncbi:MAG: DUF1573 domain-containing protein [Bacteroidales bacterium]|nr:DUF1573 domain-containing protein [Bacteroidales bacterium]